MSKNQKLLIAAVLLIVFAAAKTAALGLVAAATDKSECSRM